MRITVYDFGTITVDGRTHTRDVIIYPERVQGSWCPIVTTLTTSVTQTYARSVAPAFCSAYATH